MDEQGTAERHAARADGVDENEPYRAREDHFIARLWQADDQPERDITLLRNGGWPFRVGDYVEVEIGVDGASRSHHVHGYVITGTGDSVVIRGRIASNPRKVWANFD